MELIRWIVVRQAGVLQSHDAGESSDDSAEIVVQRHSLANIKFTRLLASLVMTSGDVCNSISRCLSCVVYLLATTWCVSVIMLFRSRAVRCRESNAQLGNAGMWCNSEWHLDMRRSSQRRGHWNACWSTGCRTCSPPFGLCIELSLRTLLKQNQGSRQGLDVMTRRSIDNLPLMSAICFRNCVCAIAAIFACRLSHMF